MGLITRLVVYSKMPQFVHDGKVGVTNDGKVWTRLGRESDTYIMITSCLSSSISRMIWEMRAFTIFFTNVGEKKWCFSWWVDDGDTRYSRYAEVGWTWIHRLEISGVVKNDFTYLCNPFSCLRFSLFFFSSILPFPYPPYQSDLSGFRVYDKGLDNHLPCCFILYFFFPLTLMRISNTSCVRLTFFPIYRPRWRINLLTSTFSLFSIPQKEKVISTYLRFYFVYSTYVLLP